MCRCRPRALEGNCLALNKRHADFVVGNFEDFESRQQRRLDATHVDQIRPDRSTVLYAFALTFGLKSGAAAGLAYRCNFRDIVFQP